MLDEAKTVRTGTLKRHWKAAILAELERILQSEHFRDSKRVRTSWDTWSRWP